MQHITEKMRVNRDALQPYVYFPGILVAEKFQLRIEQLKIVAISILYLLFYVFTVI